jgi:hypothetical protein
MTLVRHVVLADALVPRTPVLVGCTWGEEPRENKYARFIEDYWHAHASGVSTLLFRFTLSEEIKKKKVRKFWFIVRLRRTKGVLDWQSGTRGYIVSLVHCRVKKKVNLPQKREFSY